MTNNSESKNRSYIPLLIILLLLLLIGCVTIYFLFLKKPNLVYIELPHPLPLSQGDSRQLSVIGIYSDKSKKDIAALVSWRSSDPDVADVDNSGFVKSNAPGKTIITATHFETGLNAETALKVMASDIVSLSISPNTASMPPGGSVAFSAVGMYENGQTKDMTDLVKWHSSEPDIAMFKEGAPAGAVVSAMPGIATISATDDKTGHTATALLTVSEPDIVSIDIMSEQTTIPLGRELQIAAEGKFSDDSKRDITSRVSWKTANKAIAEVRVTDEGNALLISKATGTTTISAGLPDSEIQDELSITITKARMVSMKMIRKKSSIPLGKSLQLMARCTYSDGSTHVLQRSVDWSSSSPAVIGFSRSPDKKGLAVSKAAGSAVITVSDPKTGIKDTTRLTVTGQRLVSISLSPQNPSVPLGKKLQLRAKGKFSDGSVKDLTHVLKWSADNPFIMATGDIEGRKGEIASFSEGSTMIKATDPKSGVFGKTLLTVTPAELLSIAITPTSPIVSLGGTVQLSASGAFTDGSTQNVTNRLNWATENQVVAVALSQSTDRGRVKGAAEGETIVTAIDPRTGISGKAGITVTSASLVSISVSAPETQIPLGKSVKLIATGAYSDNSTTDVSNLVRWTCSNKTVAAISNDAGNKGTLSTKATGSTVVTASYDATGLNGKIDLVVIDSVLESIVVLPANPTLYIGKMKQFSATGTYSNGTQKTVTELVEWSSSDPTLSSVRNTRGRKGLANSHAVGKVTITAADPKTGLSGSTTLTTKVKW